MKRFFSLILVISVLFSVCMPVSVASNTVNVLYSDDFEDKTANTSAGGGWRTFRYSDDCAHSGKMSVKALGNNEQQTGGIFWIEHMKHYNITFEKGKSYSIRFFAMSAKTTAQIEVQLYAPKYGFISASNSNKAIPIGSWGEYVAVFNWGTKDTLENVDVRINFGGESDIYIDDFEIYEGKLEYDTTRWKDAEYEEIVPGNSATNIYVDKAAAAGGNGSINAPFNSIEAARDYIRTINSSMAKDIIVNVRGGTYQVENTIELTTEDSGTNGHYVIYQPYGYNTDNKEEVVLSGGKPVTGWTPSEIEGVYKAPLEIDYLRNLYVNDKRAQRARLNEYVTPISWWDDTDKNYTVLVEKEDGTSEEQAVYDGFVIPGGIIKNPEKATNLEIYKSVTFRSNWAVQGKAYADGENTVIKMEQPHFAMHKYADYSDLDWRITDNFRLENALEFLDEPGEWYHDADTDTLYYMPRVGEDINTCQVIAPNTEQILTVSGDSLDMRAENIIVRGFTFSDGAYKKTSRMGRVNLQGATCNSIVIDTNTKRVNGTFQYETAGNIIVTNAKNISFTDNVIKHMGGSGIMMPDGVDNCEIKGNAIYDISSSAILVGSNVHFAVIDWRTVPRNVHITNNIIGNTGVEYGTDCGIQGYYTNGLRISRNEIFNSTYSAISMGWTWDSTEDTKRNNVIEYNRIYNYGTECQDGGGIYTLGRQPNSVIRGNYIKAYAQYIVGLYHDSGSSGFKSTENVVELPADTAEQGVYKNNIGDGDLTISGNYLSNYERRFVNTDAAIMCDNYVEQGSVRSPEALTIREKSGLEGSYKALRDVVYGYSENTQIQRIYLQTEEQKEQTPANISLNKSLTLKTFGESKNGEMTVLDSNLTYQVGDTSVLSLNGNKITAIGNGITTVTVTDTEGRSAQMLVTVGDEVESFQVIADKKSAAVGKQVYVNYRLKTKYTEFVGFPRMSEMEINDTNIATVLADGSIKTVANGVATVSVNTKIGGFSVAGSTTLTVGESSYRTFKMLNYISKLKQEDIQNYLGSDADSIVAEQTFVEALASVTETDISVISENIGAGSLTREKMVAYAADALVRVYGVAAQGDSELNCYTDAADISPELIPKVALAYRNDLLSWTDGETVFNPKKEMTAADAAAFLYRFAHPENSTYLRMEEGYFNRYAIKCEEMYKNTTVNGIRKRTKQWGFEAEGEACTDISAKSGVHAGKDGVTIDSGELVRKVTRDNATDTTIVTINEIDYVPGKSYVLEFAAKVATSGKKNDLDVKTMFETANNTGSTSNTTINSTEWTNFTVPIDVPEDVEFTDTNNSVQIKFSNTFLNYTTCTVLLKDIVITEAADISIASSSIADGEKNVLTPIDSVYIYTSGAVDTASVTAEKFSITGKGASIRDVEAISEYMIRVGIDGCTYDESYTLSASGVKNQVGGFLNDTISWTTASLSGRSGSLDFENSSYTGTAYSGISEKTISDDYAHNDSGNSLKVTTTALTNLYLNSRYMGFSEFEIGKEYLVSYSIYSTLAGMIDIKHKNSQAWDGWRFCVVHIETGDSPATSFSFGALTSNAGDEVYIDDIEVAKVESFEGKRNELPKGAEATSIGYKDFEDGDFKGAENNTSSNSFSVASGGATRGTTGSYAHWGSLSYGFKGAGSDASFYFHPRLTMTAFQDCDDKLAAGKYYLSYYVCSPDGNVKTSAYNGQSVYAVSRVEVPAGNTWTKVAGIFELTQDKAANSGLFWVTAEGIGSNTVYFDDFVFAKLDSLEENVALTSSNSDVKYDYINNKATVTFTSNVALKSVDKENIVANGDVTVDSASITETGDLAIELSGLALEETYSLTVTGTDAFGRAVEGVSATFTTPLAATAPMEFASASIKDNAQNVVAPVDAFYFTTPYPVDEATLTTDKFSIAGYGASVTDVDLVNATTVKVSLGGIYPAETYTLSVAGVENTSGGVLTDYVTFTTKAADKGYSLNFENIADENGDLKVPGQLSAASASLPININTDAANSYSGSNSIYLNGIDVAAGYAMMWLTQTAANKTYRVSFYIKSDKWKLSNDGKTIFDSERGTMVGTPVVEETDKEGWRKVTAAYISNAGGIYLTLWGIAGTTVYLDNISVQEVGDTICNPVITKDGAYVTDITTGETIIELPIKGDASSVMAYVVQYDANDKMLGAVSGTYANGAFSFTLNAQAVKTKIIVMNSTTYAPLCDYIQYN